MAKQSNKILKGTTGNAKDFAITGYRAGEGKIIHRNKKPYESEKEMFGKPADFFLKKMEAFKADGFIRHNIFGKEVIWDGVKMHFSTKRARKSFKHFYIFALVKKDALDYVKKNKLKEIDWVPSTHFNLNVKSISKKEIIGTDIDTAYWNMAFKLKIISENTFEKGLSLPDKSLGLAALASLGSDKKYFFIKKGVITNDALVVLGNPKLKEVYKLIRYTCFQYMRELSFILEENYISYKTDCIYYIRNQRNVDIVTAFMEKHDLDYKMAVEPSPDDIPKISVKSE